MAAIIRSGGPADVEAALSVWRAADAARRGVGPPAVPAVREERVRGSLLKSDSFLAVAEDGGQLVGMALGMPALDDDGAGPPIRDTCHVSMVFVHPERWGQGIGRLLLRHVLVEGLGRRFVRYQLWTHAANQRAQRWYEGQGFRRSGREKNDDLGERIVHYELDCGAHPGAT